ncbi:plasmid mobilization protein [Mycolicibacterium houstonense]
MFGNGARMTTATPAPQRRSRAGSETRQRAAKIDVRFDDDERALIDRAAAASGLKPSTYLRISALERAAATLAS